jgi:hypothetical protein
MNTTEYELRQTRLQAEMRDWILRGDPNSFVTLTFRSERGVSYRRAEKEYGAFAHELKCQLFGEKSTKRIFMVPIIEGYAKEQQRTALLDAPGEHTHIHCLIRFPGNPMDYKEIVRQIWIATSGVCGDPDVYCPNSDAWFQELATDESKRIRTNYVLKTCGQDTEALLCKFVPVRHVI